MGEMLSVSLVIVADDLTGALDSVEPFATAGLPSVAAVSIESAPKALASGARVVAINTESRDVSEGEARRRIEAAWRAAAPHSPEGVFKKIDSRMKGHVAVETGALARASGRSRVVICPAAPDVGRHVEAGRLFGQGVERPMAVADHFVDLRMAATIVADSGGLSLRDHADQVRRSPGVILPVGARGLAQALADSFAAEATADKREPLNLSAPLLIVVGSRDPVTETQVRRLCRDLPQVHGIEAMDGHVDPDVLAVSAPAALLRAVSGDGQQPARMVADRLADAAADYVRRHGVRTLLCSGGETLTAVAHRLGVDWLTPLGAAAPGIPVSLGETPEGRFTMISKSGGFGDPDALVGIVARMVPAAAGASMMEVSA